MEIYEYKGKFYYWIDSGKMKINGKWADCVIYRDFITLTNYVREVDDFYSKFKQTEKQW